jgi:D-alanine-D-alanine ligase
MMAHRFFVTARAPQKAPPRRSRRPYFPQVTILMGDPTLPDSVKRNEEFNPEDFDTIDRLKHAMSELEGYEFSYLNDHNTLMQTLRTNPPQFVFNLCDEGFQNDAFKELHVPAVLEMLGIPYSGAGPACLGLAYDKALVRGYAEALDIRVPAETFFNPDDQSATIPAVFPALVKPNFGDSSIGITKDAVVRSPEELIAYLETLRVELPGRPLLVQEFLSGNEYSVGIIGNPGQGLRFLPILEVDYSNLPEDLPQILGYESKWIPDSPYWTQIRYRQAELEPEQARDLCDWSATLFERFRCRDYARVDFRADANGVIKLLEVNPNPGWCWDGKLNIMAGFEGLRYADLLRLVLEAAQSRVAGEREQLSTPAASREPAIAAR